MPFAGRPQAENKPQSAGRKIGLIRVWNDGWIEKGRRFQRVFRKEVGTDQQPSLVGRFESAGIDSRTCSNRSRKMSQMC